MAYIGNIPTTAAFVTDTFSANGSGTVFTLSVAPATTSSILVAVSGVLQDPSTYSVSGVTLTFSGAPPSGTSNISVRFLGIPASGVTTTAYRTVTEFTATSGQTSFSVPSYTVGFIDVYRNGVMLGSADYTATSGTTVVLAAGATAGDLVEVISFSVSSVLNAIPAVTNAVTTAYINNGAVTQAKLGTNVAGNGPAFSAFRNSSQTISSNTLTRINFDSELFDTASCFDTSTSRFTPNVAGYYQTQTAIQFATGVAGSYRLYGWIYKNGSNDSFYEANPVGSLFCNLIMSNLIYMNGTTDYLEVYVTQSSAGSINTASGSPYIYFSGSLVKAA